MNNTEKKYQRRGNIIRGYPRPPNKYLFGRQPKFNFNLGTGYLVVSCRKRKLFDKWDPGYENWLAVNNLPARIRPYHVSLCFESWEQINVVAASKTLHRIMHVQIAYPPKARGKVFVLKPAVAITLPQAVLLAKECQRAAVLSKITNHFEFVAKVLYKVFPGWSLKISPLDFVMNDHYIVDHSINWEGKSNI